MGGVWNSRILSMCSGTSKCSPKAEVHQILFSKHFICRSPCCCSVAKSCLTPCDPMDCSPSGFPVLLYLLEFAQIHIPNGSVGIESACSAGDRGDMDLIPRSGRSPGEGHGNRQPCQYSCLENLMDRGAWWAAVHGVRVGHS